MIYFNDASLHGQFPSVQPFFAALRVLWDIRSSLERKGLQMRICRSLRSRHVTSSSTFNEFLGNIPPDLKRRLLIWLDRDGPFWDDARTHSGGEYFECANHLVTDSGAAEAAYTQFLGTFSWLFSLGSSDFCSNPLSIGWLGRSDGDLTVTVPNGWERNHVDLCASSFDRPFVNWNELLQWAERECGNLLISPKVREQLPIQFIPNVAQRSKVLLSVLDRMIGLLKEGRREEYQALRQQWMEGEEARFTPSSKSELEEFTSELTFTHPASGRDVVCSWHGKIKTPQFRIHFEWPLADGEERLFVAYIGPKITKR